MKKKGTKNTKYSPEFKKAVILDMRENHLSYRETVRKYWQTKTRAEEESHRSQVKNWERVYLEEGAEGLMAERRGRKSSSRPRKKPLEKEIENDLMAENQRLKEQLEYAQMELEYIKKLSALVLAEEQEKNKKQ